MKIFWFARYFFYSLFFKKSGFPCYLGKPISIVGINKIKVGKKVRIYPHVRIEVHGKNSILDIQDNVGIAQNVHITCNGNLIIGKNTTILANAFITNIDHDYKEIDVPVLQQEHILRRTLIGENCFIGIGAAIQAGTILGKQCIVGTNSVVRGTFPDYCVIAGNPAKIIKQFNFDTQKWEKYVN
ncbi:acyltransferase [Acinetobacter guillouiae]|uniref:acyltransferase n=1 Tax=Acinetobacter guillouiae TaxID=106649 RepID=UPI0026E138CC|nr:DapH/DapD/GlmU-related protein [Acinetobacter guillouiae]MDO6645485.1 DapH/DapD/GlmU-related protein [Acinetobacter guillouiae]